MRPSMLAGVAAMLVVAGAAMAETRGQWQPADCASVEARSLQAELLDCDPAILGTATAGERSWEPDLEEEVAPLLNPLEASSSSTSLDPSSLEAQQNW